jgi:glyceraldehyde-3-phosphate dehydrogenase (NADP+)
MHSSDAPATERHTARFASAEEVERAVRDAVAALAPMRALPSYERAHILRGVADRIAERREELARTITEECGKPIRDSRAEVDRAVVTFTTAAEEAKRIGGETIPLDWTPGSEGRWGIVRRFPAGPVLGFTPFNFPLNLVAHKVAPALAAGCSILVKPAPATPRTALLLGALVAEAGAPAGACTVIVCDNSLAPALVDDARFAVFSFTGSSAVGWALRARAGRKKVILELGGNAALLVHRDADLDAAVRRTLIGGFSYSGQSCISVQRVYAHREVYDAYCARLVEGVRALRVGDPFDEETQVGPLVKTSEAERIAAWVEEAKGGGARVLAGGGREGAFFAPTVLTGTHPDMKVVAEEVFGPVVVVEPYDDLDGALAAVNASHYGLQAGIYTNDLRVAWRAFETLEVGTVLVNEVPTYRADHMPYGGVKDSGLGREGVRYAIEEMTEARMMLLNPK